MILKIQIGQNNPILRKKSLKIKPAHLRGKEVNAAIQKLAKDMLETMNKNNGVGLSACQIGKNIRMFVVPTELSPACRPSCREAGQGRKKWVFINPEIIKISKKTDVMEEGCLSLPGLFLPIKRAESLKIKALDENGKEFKLKTEGLLARIIQHENDHLNGILITDKNEKD
jgi:peptide deformylase